MSFMESDAEKTKVDLSVVGSHMHDPATDGHEVGGGGTCTYDVVT